jgi:hypothetical protein
MNNFSLPDANVPPVDTVAPCPPKPWRRRMQPCLPAQQAPNVRPTRDACKTPLFRPRKASGVRSLVAVRKYRRFRPHTRDSTTSKFCPHHCSPASSIHAAWIRTARLQIDQIIQSLSLLPKGEGQDEGEVHKHRPKIKFLQSCARVQNHLMPLGPIPGMHLCVSSAFSAPLRFSL